MQTDQRTIANEQTIEFDGSLGEAPKPLLLMFLTPLAARQYSARHSGTGTWSTGDDDGLDSLDT